MPKTTKARLLQNLASAFELPEDVVLDLTRITVTGNAQLLMENHKGILTYEPERIRIRTQQGETLITGRNLKIDSLFSSEMRITGSIASIEFVRFRG
ncbi:MAG: sporulation protein YqfC [Firmicutes bacterium]|nr:sporulation protein YqfC [Bacillota bacterium]